jgi:hypothetical protein
MSNDIDIRKMGRNDLTELLKAHQKLHPEDRPLPLNADLDQLWNEICRDPRLIYFGAFDGPGLAATCNAAIIPNLTRGARPFAVIETVCHVEFVLKPAQTMPLK